MKRRIILYCSFFFILVSISGQQLEVVLGDSGNGITIKELAAVLELHTEYRLFVDADSLLSIRIALKGNFSPEDALNKLKGKSSLSVYVDHDMNIFVFSKEYQVNIENSVLFKTASNEVFKIQANPEDESSEYIGTRNDFSLEEIVVGIFDPSNRSSKVSLTGYITSVSNGEPVIGATVYIQEIEEGVLTDHLGYYRIVAPPGKYTVQFGSIDTEEKKYTLSLNDNGNLDIQLQKKVFSINEVVISATQDKVAGTNMGFQKLTAAAIKEIPTVLGERDVIKVAQLLPGIQSVGEGTAGLNVRGSPADQNAFYINNMPIYNTSHLMGFFSTINSDAIEEFSISKANIPIEYGGRLSSLFDITPKTGNRKKFSASGGISPITSRLLIEGPIVKDKISYLFAGRTIYSDWMLNLVDNVDIRNSSAWFGDGLSNIYMKINDNNHLNFFLYGSSDKFKYSNIVSYNYQNSGGAINWEHVISEKHRLTTNFSRSIYKFREENMEISVNPYRHNYSLAHNELKSKITIRPSNNFSLNGGINAIYYQIDKGEYMPLSDSSMFISKNLGKEYGLEGALFASVEYELNPVLIFSAGFRQNMYLFLGPQQVYDYAEGAPRLTTNIVDTLSFRNKEIAKSSFNPDFRFGFNIRIKPGLAFKMSYNILHQYINLLTTNVSVSPTDKWKLSDYHLEPLTGEQISLGVYARNSDRMYEMSMEGYVKRVKNIVEYKDGADVQFAEIFETELLQGDLRAFGAEFMVEKKSGKLNGWLSYSYSRALAQIDDDLPENKNNFGLEYAANYDKPHSLNFVGNYRFSRRVSISGNVIYSTGRPITLPNSVYYINGQRILNYSKRNEYRIPDYFRTDVSLNVEGSLLSKKLAHSSLMFSVYNLTGRRNPYSIYFTLDDNHIQGYKLSIFGTQIFTVTYTFKLGNYASL